MGRDLLPDEELAARLAELPGRDREGDTITRAFGVRHHGGVALIVNVADIERLVGHHADIDLRWDRAGPKSPTGTVAPAPILL